jgi:predicted DsbA family dithiol-disulfide isomerase
VASSLEKLESSHDDVEIVWHSYMLRPPGSPPISPEYRAKILAGRPRMAEMAERDFGVEMNFGTFSGTSKPALVGGKYAEAHGKGEAYHKQIMLAYWVETKSIHDLDVLGDIAADIGLDRQEFLDSLDSEPWTTQVAEDVDHAFQYGIQGVPGMVFNDKYYVSGAQTHEVLEDIVRQVREKDQA